MEQAWSYTYLPWRIKGADREREGPAGGGRCGSGVRQERKGDFPRLMGELKVTAPNDVTALICWRLAVERVFNQSV